MLKVSRSLTAAALALAGTSALAAVPSVATYLFTGTVADLTALAAPNVTAGAVTLGADTTSSGAAGANVLSIGLAPSLGGPSTGTFDFTVDANSGYELDLASLNFRAAALLFGSSFSVASSVDGYSSQLLNVMPNTGVPNYASYFADLSGPSFQNLTGPVTFRVTVSSFDEDAIALDSITVNGSAVAVTSSVPEPGSYALMLASLAALGAVARRRKD